MEGATPLIRQFLSNARRSFTKPAEKFDLHAWGLLWYMRSSEIENKTRENPGFIWFPWFSLGHDWFFAGRQNWGMQWNGENRLTNNCANLRLTKENKGGVGEGPAQIFCHLFISAFLSDPGPIIVYPSQ